MLAAVVLSHVMKMNDRGELKIVEQFDDDEGYTVFIEEDKPNFLEGWGWWSFGDEEDLRDRWSEWLLDQIECFKDDEKNLVQLLNHIQMIDCKYQPSEPDDHMKDIELIKSLSGYLAQAEFSEEELKQLEALVDEHKNK